MEKRFLSLWFRHLKTDYATIRQPALKDMPFVLAIPDHGRKIITATNQLALREGIQKNMAAADARILIPNLEILDDKPELGKKLLHGLALWCIRYTPIVAAQEPDGLILDISGCAHLWGGERSYFTQIVTTLKSKGYDVRGAIADTVGAAWAVAHFGRITPLITPGEHSTALLNLPPAALRIEPTIAVRLQKLGLNKIHQFVSMPRQTLRLRFGNEFLQRLDQAFGTTDEPIEPIIPVEPYIERLPCLEPIRTAGGIEIALKQLLETLCSKLQQDGKGLRTAQFKGYRIDGQLIQISIGTNKATHNTVHLFKLFEEKITTLEPDPGIEVFTLEAPKVEDVNSYQPAMWNGATGLQDNGLTELIDRVTNKVGPQAVHRYLPAEHFWPERAITITTSLDEIAVHAWSISRPRPIHILKRPEPIEVTAPIPDYPPMLFIHKGQRHKIAKAEGPERIEQEWWFSNGEHRDYYSVENEQGVKFWIFRLGHYNEEQTGQWYLHGYFA